MYLFLLKNDILEISCLNWIIKLDFSKNSWWKCLILRINWTPSIITVRFQWLFSKRDAHNCDYCQEVKIVQHATIYHDWSLRHEGLNIEIKAMMVRNSMHAAISSRREKECIEWPSRNPESCKGNLTPSVCATFKPDISALNYPARKFARYTPSAARES